MGDDGEILLGRRDTTSEGHSNPSIDIGPLLQSMNGRKGERSVGSISWLRRCLEYRASWSKNFLRSSFWPFEQSENSSKDNGGNSLESAFS